MLGCHSFPYLASEVTDNESIRGSLWLLEVGAAEVGLVKLLCPAPITALGHLKGKGVRRGALGGHSCLVPALLAHLALLIQQVQDAEPALDELNAWLVVTEVNEDPRDLLGHILLLLQLEDVLAGRENRARLSQEGTKVTSYPVHCR